MTEPEISRSITFHRKHEAITATTDTENPDAPVELIRRYPDNSGNEVLASFTQTEWTELLVFVAEEGGLNTVDLGRLERRPRSASKDETP